MAVQDYTFYYDALTC